MNAPKRKSKLKRFRPKQIVPVSDETRALLEELCKRAGLKEIPPSLLVCSVPEPVEEPETQRGASAPS